MKYFYAGLNFICAFVTGFVIWLIILALLATGCTPY